LPCQIRRGLVGLPGSSGSVHSPFAPAGRKHQREPGFDRKPPSENPWTQKLWIYDFRTNQNFTLKTRALVRADLDDFVACHNPANRYERTETERFRAFSYDELVARDKASLDIFWLRDESLEDTGNLPAPELIAAEIVEDLQAALGQFAAIASSLGAADTTSG
jgi:type I restriction enzyme M protein